MRLFAVPITTFLLFKSWDEISFKGEGCDTSGVTVIGTMFLQYLCNVTINVSQFKFKFKFEFKTLSWNNY
jgi:hypothetical protein